MQSKIKKTVIPVLLSILILTLSFATSCTVGNSVIKKLPDEKILKVVRVNSNVSDDNEIELPEDEISSFLDFVSVLKYKKRYNIFGIKTFYSDGIDYIITYDNYTVTLSRWYLYVYHNDEKEKGILFRSVQPLDAFNEIDKLFDS